jgi:hypothetical protein
MRRTAWIPLVLLGACGSSRPSAPDAAAAPKPVATPALRPDAAAPQGTIEDRLAALRPVVVAAPPLDRFRSPQLGDAAAPPIRLVERSSERNKITDELDWLETYQLSIPSASESAERPLPRFFREKMRLGAVEDGGTVLLLFGDPGGGAAFLALLDAGRNPIALFDFSAWVAAHVPITWAVLDDRVLYVAASNLYAAERSDGKNAFLAAVDRGSGALLWQSRPLVANSRTFVLHEGVIFTGYGFTAEPDFLFVLDARSGEVLQELKVKSGPEILIRKDDLLHVRAYDRNYVFGITR